MIPIIPPMYIILLSHANLIDLHVDAFINFDYSNISTTSDSCCSLSRFSRFLLTLWNGKQQTVWEVVN